MCSLDDVAVVVVFADKMTGIVVEVVGAAATSGFVHELAEAVEEQIDR